MPKEIYIVAGSRNMLTAKAQGGLWANVGETRVGVEARLMGDDYRRKAAGGDWVVIARYAVPPDASDKDVHRALKAHPGARWVRSPNTEEFFFPGDRGDGAAARRAVEDCLPAVVQAPTGSGCGPLGWALMVVLLLLGTLFGEKRPQRARR